MRLTRRVHGAAAAVLAATLLLGACSGSDDDAPAAEPPATSAPAATPSATATPSAPAEQPAEELPPVRDRLSLPALMREPVSAGRLRETAVEYSTDAYTRSRVTYRSGRGEDAVVVSGVLLRPRGRGPFPGIVLNHGYIEPSVYEPGQGLAREQDYLARAGFAVLHTDYRGHAGSEPPVGPYDRETRLGYTRDAAAAVRALEREPYVDADRMAMLGRSMGGGVTLNALVAHPGLVDAAVVYASVSSDYLENLRWFTEPNRPEELTGLFERLGTPRANPRAYRDLSSRSYFDRVTEPVLLHHGTVDETCPPRWARATQRLLDRAGVQARTQWWEGEGHTFYAAWERSMEQTVRFLRRQLRST